MNWPLEIGEAEIVWWLFWWLSLRQCHPAKEKLRDRSGGISTSALAEITGQKSESTLKSCLQEAIFSFSWILQEEGLRFQLRSWRVDTGSRTPER
jgi:hypothetical protein